VTYLELVELDEVELERAAQPMPTELGTLDALHLATAVLWWEMPRVDLVMATHDTALGMAARAHGFPVGDSALSRVVTFSTESRRLWQAIGVRWVLCWSYALASVGDFSSNPANCASVRNRGVGGSNHLAPTTLSTQSRPGFRACLLYGDRGAPRRPFEATCTPKCPELRNRHVVRRRAEIL